MSKTREEEKAMMERNRETRRGAMASVNGGGGAGGGGGLTRRRQLRTANLRDSPEEDGAMEMQEPPRLRDRGIRKDRDRDRDRSSIRSKRRRGERLMHGSNREEGDDSSEESTDNDEDDDEDDATVVVRLPPSNSALIASSSSSIQQQNHHHVRKSSFPAKPVRPQPAAAWKVAEEVIGVSIPRKARTSSMKRSQDCWVSGEMTHRQASTSPARPSPSSATAISPAAAISPSSSNVSVRRKKPISVSKHRPPKMAKSSAASSSIQEIEIEVAEALFSMTRQAPPAPVNNTQESSKIESKESNGLNTEATTQTPMAATVPKRKRPRLKLGEESPTRTESETPVKTEEAASSSPRAEKMTSASTAIENGVGSAGTATAAIDAHQDSDSKGLVESKEQSRVKEEVGGLPSKSKEASCVDSDAGKPDEATAAAAAKAVPANESPHEEKFSIDLMAPPPLPEKSSSEDKSLVADKKIVVEYDIVNREAENSDKALKNEGMMPSSDDRSNAGKFLAEEFDMKQQQTFKEKALDLQLDLEKHDKDGLTLSSSSKQQHQQQVPKHQQLKQSARVEPKQEKPAQSASLQLPVSMPGWPGGFPYFGYVGQGPPLQAVLPMDASTSASAKTLQPPPHLIQAQPMPRPKRCSTHLYIAQNIHYHQQIARMNPLWSSPSATAAMVAAAAAAPVYGGAGKQYNLNTVPPASDSSAAILGNSLQVGGFPQRSLDKSTPAAVAMVYTGPPPKEKSSASAAATNSNNAYMEQAAQAQAQAKQQFLIQQSPQSGASPLPPNMIHGPAFIIPINQQPSSSVANHRAGGATSLKSTTPVNSSSPAGGPSVSLTAGHPAATTTLSFNYPNLSPNDAAAQYMAILPNNAAYSFPIAAAQVGGPPPYRGTGGGTAANPGGQPAIPFMPFLTPPQQQQLQQKQRQQLMQTQSMNQQLIQQQMQQLSSSSQSHPKPTTSAGSSTSQKRTHHQSQQQQQQQRLGPPHEDSPSTADSSSRASQAQKSIYGAQNFAGMSSMHSPPNFALISSPTTGAGGGHNENKNQQQQAMKMELSPQAAYAMSFSPFGGFAAAAGAAAPGGFDFPAIVQNPALFQNLPEVSRHGYQIATAAAAAAAVQQHKKAAQLEEGKSGGDSHLNANVAATEEGKKNNVAASVGHSLNFARPDNDPPSVPPNILSTLTDNANNARALNPTGSGNAPPSNTSGSALASTINSPSSQQQQHMIQFRKNHQQVMQFNPHMQQQQMQMMSSQQQMQMMSSHLSMKTSSHNNNAPPPGATMASTMMAARFPQGGLAGFPPSLIQQGSGNDAAMSLQWKAATSGARTAPTPATPPVSSAATTSSSSAKNQIPQQHQQQSNKPLGGSHQTQISFGVSSSSNKPLGGAGSPQNSISKTSATAAGGGGGENSGNSPRASSSFKPGQPPGSIQQNQPVAANLNKSSSSSPIPNRNNMTPTSILGHHPHVIPSSNSSGTTATTKNQQQSQQQQQQQQFLKQSFQQPPPHIFNNSYIQQQASSSVAGGLPLPSRDHIEQLQQLRRLKEQAEGQEQQDCKSRLNASIEQFKQVRRLKEQAEGQEQQDRKSRSNASSVAGGPLAYRDQVELRLHEQAARHEQQVRKSRSNSSDKVGGLTSGQRQQIEQLEQIQKQQQQHQQHQKANQQIEQLEQIQKQRQQHQKANQVTAGEIHKQHQKVIQQAQSNPHVRHQMEQLEELRKQHQQQNNKSTNQQAKSSSTATQSSPGNTPHLPRQIDQLIQLEAKPSSTPSTTESNPGNPHVQLDQIMQLQKQCQNNSTPQQAKTTSQSNTGGLTPMQRQQLQLGQIRQQKQQNPTTSGMLSLSSSSASPTSDSTAAKASSSIKATQYPPGAFMTPRPPSMSSPGFPYIHTMPPSSVSAKPASVTPDQKQSATNRKENVHACWKPEKR